jgi:hypothetical protein
MFGFFRAIFAHPVAWSWKAIFRQGKPVICL